jgi:hypothetical protein
MHKDAEDADMLIFYGKIKLFVFYRIAGKKVNFITKIVFSK